MKTSIKPEGGKRMNQSDTRIVTDINGQRGTIESLPDTASGANATISVRLENGQKMLVPMDVLTRRADGSYSLPFALSEFHTNSTVTGAAGMMQTTLSTQAEHQARQVGENFVVPVIAEEIIVDKRVVETGGVRIHKTVHERQQTVDVPLIEDHVEVERIAVNRVLDGPAEVRREGETLIVPLLEEVLVVEKRLMLKEELHIRMRREEVHSPQQVTLRREEVNIERFAAEESVSVVPGVLDSSAVGA